MTDLLQRPPQAKTQDAPLHRAAPPAANQTNMRTRGMVPVQHFAGGGTVQSANRFAPANEMASAPVMPAAPAAPFNPVPGAAAYGRGVDFLNGVVGAVTPAVGPPVDMAARFRPPPIDTSLSGTAPHAPAGTSTAPHPIDAYVAATGLDPRTPTAPAQPALAPDYLAQAAGLAGPQHGTLDHATENPHQYSLPEFLKATEGMSNQQFYKMMGLTHQRTMQEQAGGLALQMALHGDNDSPQFNLLRGLASPVFGSPWMGGNYNASAGTGMY